MGYMVETIGLWFTSGIGAVVKALLIFLLAFAAAALAKKFVVKLWNTLPFVKRLPAEALLHTKEFVGSAAYLLVFLLFIPGVLAALGLNSISQPIMGILSTIWGYLPNIVAAGIILATGVIVARLVRQLLAQAISNIQLTPLKNKFGADVPSLEKLAETAAYTAYILILIPIAITALQVLDLDAISLPAVEMLSRVIAFIPNIVVGIILVMVGGLIGKLSGQIVEKMLSASGLDEKLIGLLDEGMKTFQLSKAAGITVKVVVDIFFVVEALNALHLEMLKQIGTAIIGYMPSVLAAVLITMGCMLAVSVIAKLLKNQKKIYIRLARTAIFVLGAFMVLSQLGVAGTLVNAAFILLVGALAIAFAVAFGLGGRDFAARMLERLEKGWNCKDKSEN